MKEKKLTRGQLNLTETGLLGIHPIVRHGDGAQRRMPGGGALAHGAHGTQTSGRKV